MNKRPELASGEPSLAVVLWVKIALASRQRFTTYASGQKNRISGVPTSSTNTDNGAPSLA